MSKEDDETLTHKIKTNKQTYTLRFRRFTLRNSNQKVTVTLYNNTQQRNIGEKNIHGSLCMRSAKSDLIVYLIPVIHFTFHF